MRAVLVLVLLLAACSDDDVAAVDAGGIDGAALDAVPAADSAPASDAFPFGDGGIVGGIQVREYSSNLGGGGAGTVWLYGFWDRPMRGELFGIVEEMQWEPTIVEGDCFFLDQMIPGFCTPACDGSTEWCTPDDVCEPYPVTSHAGVITIDGLSIPVTETPDGSGYYTSDVEAWPADLYTPGDLVTATAAGGPLPAFTLSAIAPADLGTPLPCDLPFVVGTPLDVTWTPAGGEDRVRLDLVSAYHAGDGPMIVCDSPDDGALTIPASIVDAYLAVRTDKETYEMTRYRRGYAGVGGGRVVGLEVGSQQICFHY